MASWAGSLRSTSAATAICSMPSAKEVQSDWSSAGGSMSRISATAWLRTVGSAEGSDPELTAAPTCCWTAAASLQNCESAAEALVFAALELLALDPDDAESSEPPQAASRTTAATANPLRHTVSVRRMVARLTADARPWSGRASVPDVDAPADPRARWALPAPGRLPRTADLEPLVTRVLAPNASAMTRDGTNTYVVGAPGSGQAVLVDPGPDDPAHLAAVEAALADRDARCVAVLVTHHHGDHAEAAIPWGARFGAPVAAAAAEVAGPSGRVLEPGERLRLAGTVLGVVATPGHCGDHLAFRLESGAVLVGDHVLGRGTSVVTHPEGDVVAYLESLRRVHDLGPSALYCGHGPELTDNPGAVLEFYLDHRAFRETQILTALAGGPCTVDELVETIYAAVPEALWPAAAQSTRATLAKLLVEDRVQERADGAVALT